MKKQFSILFMSVLLFTIQSNGFSQSFQESIERYYGKLSSKDGHNDWVIEKATANGKRLAAIFCESSSYVERLELNPRYSKIAGKDIYGLQFQYLIPYDENSYVLVSPNSDEELGEGVWEYYLYVNFFSKDKEKVKNTTPDELFKWIEQYTESLLPSQRNK